MLMKGSGGAKEGTCLAGKKMESGSPVFFFFYLPFVFGPESPAFAMMCMKHNQRSHVEES